MRKIALGRLHIPAKDFYLMTLAELFDAIDGHKEEEHNRLQWHLWGLRRQIYFQVTSAGAKDIKEEDIIPLEMDDEIRKQRHSQPPMTVTNGEAIQ